MSCYLTFDKKTVHPGNSTQGTVRLHKHSNSEFPGIKHFHRQCCKLPPAAARKAAACRLVYWWSAWGCNDDD